MSSIIVCKFIKVFAKYTTADIGKNVFLIGIEWFLNVIHDINYEWYFPKVFLSHTI